MPRGRGGADAPPPKILKGATRARYPHPEPRPSPPPGGGLASTPFAPPKVAAEMTVCSRFWRAARPTTPLQAAPSSAATPPGYSPIPKAARSHRSPDRRRPARAFGSRPTAMARPRRSPPIEPRGWGDPRARDLFRSSMPPITAPSIASPGKVIDRYKVGKFFTHQSPSFSASAETPEAAAGIYVSLTMSPSIRRRAGRGPVLSLRHRSPRGRETV